MALFHVSHPPWLRLVGVRTSYIYFSNISWTPWVLDPITNPFLGPSSWLHPASPRHSGIFPMKCHFPVKWQKPKQTKDWRGHSAFKCQLFSLAVIVLATYLNVEPAFSFKSQYPSYKPSASLIGTASTISSGTFYQNPLRSRLSVVMWQILLKIIKLWCN